MAKVLLFSAIISQMVINGREYVADENGSLEVEEEDVAAAIILGATPEPDYDAVVAPVPSPFDNGDEIAVLRAQLAEAEARAQTAEEALAATASDTAGGITEGAKVDDAGDTASGDDAGDTGADKADLANVLPKPIDDMSRDEMVDWLSPRGVTLASNVSKTVARQAVEDKLSESAA